MTEGAWSWDKIDVDRFYEDLGEAEWNRLTRNFYQQLEWEGTISFLESTLPDDGHVLDAGGAAGRYSVWLAERGYDVTLVDISETQLDVAREKVDERDLDDHVRIQQGDIRDLDFADETFDATLCLGAPLSHVLEDRERETAAAELGRVTDPGGPVFVSVVGRLAMLQFIIQQIGRRPDGSDNAALLADFAEHGTYDRELLEKHDCEPHCFEAHFFRADELEALLERAGLDVQELAGLEGIASQRRLVEPLDETADEAARESVAETVAQLRTDRTVADMSAHILAVARA
jgi:SAM-dependent methyltransferase